MVPGVALFLVGIAYFFLTQDAPLGNYKELRAKGLMPQASQVRGTFLMAAKDYRVWALFVIYGACFVVELTINNIAALYYFDTFELDLKTAGLIAGLFGLMNLFARTLGGIFGDKFGIKFGLKGRVMFLGVVLLVEGIALMVFSQMATLFLAVGAMIVFSLFVQMSEGATFSVVPFVNRKALGSVAGHRGRGRQCGRGCVRLSVPRGKHLVPGRSAVRGRDGDTCVGAGVPGAVLAGDRGRGEEDDVRGTGCSRRGCSGSRRLGCKRQLGLESSSLGRYAHPNGIITGRKSGAPAN